MTRPRWILTVFSLISSLSAMTRFSMPQIFNPFYTTKLNGLAMGLSTGLSIVEAHSGRLGRAEPGKGGRFPLQPAERREGVRGGRLSIAGASPVVRSGQTKTRQCLEACHGRGAPLTPKGPRAHLDGITPPAR